jgi:hypothetical protein
MNKAICTTLLMGGLIASVQAQAQDAPKPDFSSELASRSDLDLSVPASPAFALLGLSPSNIQRPGTIRELVSAVARGFDKNGKPKNGLAIDIAPLPIISPESIIGGDTYAKDPFIPVLTRTTVSLGTSEVAGGASQLAWGIRVGVFDRGDPGYYGHELHDCVIPVLKDKGLLTVSGGPTTEEPPEDKAKRHAAIKEVANECAAQVGKERWAKPAVYVGYGQSWYSSTGALSDRAPAAQSWWATGTAGRALKNWRALLQLHAERQLNERYADKDDPNLLHVQASTSLIARFKIGAPKWHAYADLGRKRVLLDGVSNAKVRYSGFGAEFKIKDDVWLQLGNTSERGFNDGSSQMKVLAGIRFGSEPFLVAPGGAK